MDSQSSPLSPRGRADESDAQGTNSPPRAQYATPGVRPFDPDELAQRDAMELTQLRIRNLLARYSWLGAPFAPDLGDVAARVQDAQRCASGRHVWLDPVSRGRCCNGWHQELRTAPAHQLTPEEWTTGGATLVSSMLEEGVWVWRVWVRDETPAIGIYAVARGGQ